MQLLTLFLLLIGPYVILTLIQKVSPDVKISDASKARIGVSLMFIATSMSHFLQTAQMSEMIPELFPYRELIIFLTGFPELFGAIFIWIPPLRRLSGIFLIAMLLALLPFNIYAAFHGVQFGGHSSGPFYLLIRVPFQFLVMWIVYIAAGLDWFKFRKETE
jgi:uncharacterized membrane protein